MHDNITFRKKNQFAILVKSGYVAQYMVVHYVHISSTSKMSPYSIMLVQRGS